ncbi:hypothetical protein OS190_08250 [Sulfitobacter sp. F26204]|uniref:hypothetical protein n=1 Tax=Sulfitobacter sp. F26204 TaxID=2996014 RepID=UPI00225E4AAD|nr:hypothetical protein [Sulfitobacter sp. F26204]MCX7559561.1 hypothetical protein [Sulfitobacter sp. F26204]
MNQIINMIIRQVMNQLVRRGINAGIDKAGQMGQRRKAQQLPPDALDDYGNPLRPEVTRQDRNHQQRSRQQARQQRQQMKLIRRLK